MMAQSDHIKWHLLYNNPKAKNVVRIRALLIQIWFHFLLLELNSLVWTDTNKDLSEKLTLE